SFRRAVSRLRRHDRSVAKRSRALRRGDRRRERRHGVEITPVLPFAPSRILTEQAGATSAPPSALAVTRAVQCTSARSLAPPPAVPGGDGQPNPYGASSQGTSHRSQTLITVTLVDDTERARR